MSEELGQKSEELWKYHAEQSLAFSRIRELVGNRVEIVNKAHLYDRMMATGDPASARQTFPILVKYSRTMKDILAEIQKVVPPGHTPRQVLYQGAPGSPTGTLHEVVGEVPLVQNPPTFAGPSQQEGGTRPSSSRRAPSGSRSAKVRRKSTGSVRTGRDQSPVRRTSDRSRTPDQARTPIRKTEPAALPSRGRGTPTRTPPTSPADGLKTSPAPQPPSRAAFSRDPRTTPSSGRQEQVQHLGDKLFPLRSVRRGSTVSGTPRFETLRAEGVSDLEEEVAPSPNMRRMLTRLQRVLEAGGSSAANSPGSHTKEGVAQKKHRSS